jgi:hypothetical protein
MKAIKFKRQIFKSIRKVNYTLKKNIKLIFLPDSFITGVDVSNITSFQFH